MTLKVVQGDLLQSECDIIIHQANCLGIMGAGIAKQIKNLYPEVYKADLSFPIPVKDLNRVGEFSYAEVTNPYTNKKQTIVNMYSQYDIGKGKTNYYAMEKALKKIILFYLSPAKKIGLPYGIGCGLAGGDWEEVYSILEKVSEEYHQDLYLYKL